jgi:hypothetical protein
MGSRLPFTAEWTAGQAMSPDDAAQSVLEALAA